MSVLSARGSTADLTVLGERAEGVKAYFAQHLGLQPVEESRAYITYLVPR